MTEPTSYKTLRQPGDSELVVERSRFLGFAQPTATLEEALEFVERVRKEHYDARHVCYGLRVGHGARCVDRSNDDGEPARTGGFPIWQLLDGDDVTNAIVVVVRYYGGVKLGTGGLARAYRGAARDAIDVAGIVTIWPTRRLDLTVSYDTVGKLEHWLLDFEESVTVADKTYAADVTFHLDVRLIDAEDVKDRLAEFLQRSPDTLEYADG